MLIILSVTAKPNKYQTV